MTDEILNIIIKSLNKEATEKEEQLLERWLHLNETNLSNYHQFIQVWHNTTNLDQKKNEAWSDLSQKIKSPQKFQKSIFNYRNVLTKAAFISMVLLSGFLGYQLISQNSPIKQVDNVLVYQSVFTRNGEIKEITLPDKSIVKLNNSSKIEYPINGFKGEERVIKLSGEAYFEVTHNSQKPFIVKTDNFTVKVLGTSFNVKAYQIAENQNVSVVTGKVKLTTKGGNHEIFLSKGETAMINSKTKMLSKVNSKPNLLKWIVGTLVFDGDKFDEIVQKISLHFDVNIKINNKKIDYERSFVGSFENEEEINEVLDVLSYYYNFSYKIKDEKTVILN